MQIYYDDRESLAKEVEPLPYLLNGGSSGGSVVLIPDAGVSPDAILKTDPVDAGVVDPSGKVYISSPDFNIGLPTAGGVKRSITEITGAPAPGGQPIYTAMAAPGAAAPTSNLLPIIGLGLLAWFLMK